MNPCPRCGASRAALEADCAECRWSPRPARDLPGCQQCGRIAPPRYVVFHQNIGLLIMRLSHTAEGNFCKACIHRTFWRCTLITLTCGWWGLVSLAAAPICLTLNVARYLPCLRMPNEYGRET